MPQILDRPTVSGDSRSGGIEMFPVVKTDPADPDLFKGI